MSRRGQIGDHRLEIQQRFEAALGNLGLIRRVLRVPAGILQNIALDDGGRDAIVIAHADEGPENLVLGGDFLQRGQGFVLGLGRGQLERLTQTNVLRHGGGNQPVQGFEPGWREHFTRLSRVRADVTAHKLVGMRR